MARALAADDGGGDWQLACGQIRERGARLLASGQWADCSFLPGAGQHAAPVKAHRLILAMASPVFQAMFYGPLAEGDAPIPVPDVQPDVFIKLLQYVYTDDLDLENYETAIEVYYAAEKYMLPHLQVLCTKYLTDNLVPQNACGIYEFANFIEDNKLESKSLKIIQDDTKLALDPDSSFEDLALGTAIHIFSRDRLTIDSELDLLAAAERYVLAQQKGHLKMVDSKTSSSEAIPENGSVSKSLENDTNKEDTVECNPSNQQQPLACLDSKMGSARSEASFRFTVHNIRNVNDWVLSPPCYVRNLPWKIMVKPYNQQKDLGFFLQCDGESESSSWSCYARAELRLISHKPDTEPLCEKIQHLFSRKAKGWGFTNFVAWNKVLNPDMGYIKDESITLEVHVIADAPDGVSWDYTVDTNIEPAVVPASQEVVNKARSEATFRFTFNNVSKMEGIVSRVSPPFYVRNLPWKIVVEPVDDEGQKYLGFYVKCNEGSKSIMWSCKALIEGRLISHKPNIEPCYRSSGKYRCFSSSDSVNDCWGYPHFMAWNDVLDPEKGYVKDDAITVEVHVIAEPPQGLSWHSKKSNRIGDVDIEDESVRELLRQIKFLTLTGKQMSEYEPKLSLLTDQDILTIMMNICSEETKKPLPLEFSKSRSLRTSKKSTESEE